VDISLLKNIDPKLLLKYKVGLEREGLRVDQTGKLSKLPHPIKLGSSLTNPFFTTDFAEQQLEIVTSPRDSIEDLYDNFNSLHSYALKNMKNSEIIWNYSMPCHLTDEEIKIADFGSSNTGKFKRLYRKGLHNRYGKKMQMISGIHFNFSFSDEMISEMYEERDRGTKEQSGKDLNRQDFVSEIYMHICRNFLRLSSLLTYIFGKSPVYLQDFLNYDHPDLKSKNDCCYKKSATSFRMSDIGYSNSKQCKFQISYNGIDDYTKDLYRALKTQCVKHEKIDKSKQLNDKILQIEAEYYNLIRPKPKMLDGKKNADLLNENGVDYIEFRGIDIDLNEPLGISKDKLYFLHLFIIYCLEIESPNLSDKEKREITQNQKKVALNGISNKTKILKHGKNIPFHEYGISVLKEIEYIANILDSSTNHKLYLSSLRQQIKKFENPTISKNIQETVLNQNSFNEYILKKSKAHAKSLRNKYITNELKKELDELSKKSIEDQLKLEKNDKISFEDFVLENTHHKTIK